MIEIPKGTKVKIKVMRKWKTFLVDEHDAVEGWIILSNKDNEKALLNTFLHEEHIKLPKIKAKNTKAEKAKRKPRKKRAKKKNA